MKAAQAGEGDAGVGPLKVSSKGKWAERESFVFSCTPINRATLGSSTWCYLRTNTRSFFQVLVTFLGKTFTGINGSNSAVIINSE